MAPKSEQNELNMCPNTEATNDPKLEPNRRQNGAKMDPKRHPKINVFLDGFLEASGNIGGTASRPRVGRDCRTFGGRGPQGTAA